VDRVLRHLVLALVVEAVASTVGLWRSPPGIDNQFRPT
jgi:hypothetical protein